MEDDESMAEEKPAVNSTKREAESSEVIELKKQVAELQQTNAKLEKNFKGACRIADEAQARVQFLETLVDIKPIVVDGAKSMELEKKVSELTSELEYMRMKYQVKKDRNNELKKKVRDLTVELKEERVKNRTRDERKEELWENVPHSPATQSDEEHEDRVRNRTRMDDLTRRLSTIELRADQAISESEDARPIPQSPWREVDTSARPARTSAMLDEEADPVNILQLCRPDAPGTFSLDRALKKLKAKLEEKGVYKKHKKLCKERRYPALLCKVCNKVCRSEVVLHHFCSGKHIKQARARGAAVSFAAYQHWIRLLHPFSDAAKSDKKAK